MAKYWRKARLTGKPKPQGPDLSFVPLPSVLKPGRYKVVDSKTEGGSCSPPVAENPGELLVPLINSPSARAVRAHEYAHLALTDGEPRINALVLAGIPEHVAQATQA